MLPHVHVHRGGEHDRAGEGQVEGGEEVVGQAVGEFRDQVGSGGRDHQDFVLLGHRDVLDGVLDGEEIGEDFAAGEGGEGQGLDELLRRAGHHHLHGVVLLHEQAGEFRGLVGRDAATYAEENSHNEPV